MCNCVCVHSCRHAWRCGLEMGSFGGREHLFIALLAALMLVKVCKNNSSTTSVRCFPLEAVF